MLRILPGLIELALIIYCIIDLIQTRDAEVSLRWKLVWIVVILMLPFIGGIAWLVARQLRRSGSPTAPGSSTRPAGFPGDERPRVLGPDDDPDFLRQLKSGNDEKDRLLKRSQEDRRRREQQLKPPADPDADPRREDGSGG